VIARSSWLPAVSEQARAAVEESFKLVAGDARRVLARRWPEAKAVFIDAPPSDAILAEAMRFQASLVVLGWRGHGTFRRLLTGSVSRNVAAKAQCPVLVVREPAKAVRRFVVGFDGCPNSERALDFLSSLEPARGNRVVLVNVVEPVPTPTSLGRFPRSMRAAIGQQVAALNEEQRQQAEAAVVAAAAQLARSGWTVRGKVRSGAPLASLVEAVEEHRADVLMLGARATGGLEHLLLGSVANGALDRSPVPVLLVR
jgi:nucleotide-binding universal stress UspA family protein